MTAAGFVAAPENELMPFEHPAFGKVRVVMDETTDGKPWFVAKDVAIALGYAEPRRAVGQHCKGGCKMHLPTAGGVQETTIIPRGDVYRLIIRSKLPSAERFESWVMEEVLPAIRKHGMYATPHTIDTMLAVRGRYGHQNAHRF